MSLALGKIVGVYLLIMGISLLARRQGWMHAVKEIRKSQSTLKLLATLELLVGLVIVVYHNVWVAGWPVIVTVIGWVMVVEGVAYLFVSHDTIAKKIKAFNKPGWYMVTGIVSVLLGAYMVIETFNLFS